MNARPVRLRLLGSLGILLVSGSLFAQDVPVRDWEVPAGELRKTGGSGLGFPVLFSPIGPCRLYDSRISSGGPGPIPGSGTRTLDFVPGGSPACGPLPIGARQLSAFVTVVGPLGPGFIYAYAAFAPPSTPTSIINYNGTPGELRNNATILPLNTAPMGGFTIGTGGAGTDIIIDINGLFYNDLEFTHHLEVFGSSAGPMIGGVNAGSFPNASGIFGQIVHSDPGAGSAGVRGRALTSVSADAIYGGRFENNNGGTESAAVLANSDASSGVVYGLFADNDSISSRSAGVFGRSGNNVLPAPSAGTYGVVGTNYNSGNTRNVGVGGFAQGGTEGWGVFGARDTGVLIIGGVLGYTNTSGVHSFSAITAAGTKSFIEPHPTDPGLEIAYVSLEGPEAGTYFRGRARVQNGLARIPVPESFRLVSEEEGLSIQAMPIGEMATFAVMRIDLNEIVVKASRNVEFFYTVNGVRKGHAGFQAIRKNEYFRPASAEDSMREWPPEVRERLMANGTLTPGGSPNLETAERLGWKADWEKQAAEAKAIERARSEKEIPEGEIR